MALSGSWPKCPPSSASCCLRAASTFGLRQPSGSRRRSRGGHYGHDPSTSHVIMSQFAPSRKPGECQERARVKRRRGALPKEFAQRIPLLFDIEDDGGGGETTQRKVHPAESNRIHPSPFVRQNPFSFRKSPSPLSPFEREI